MAGIFLKHGRKYPKFFLVDFLDLWLYLYANKPKPSHDQHINCR